MNIRKENPILVLEVGPKVAIRYLISQTSKHSWEKRKQDKDIRNIVYLLKMNLVSLEVHIREQTYFPYFE